MYVMHVILFLKFSKHLDLFVWTSQPRVGRSLWYNDVGIYLYLGNAILEKVYKTAVSNNRWYQEVVKCLHRLTTVHLNWWKLLTSSLNLFLHSHVNVKYILNKVTKWPWASSIVLVSSQMIIEPMDSHSREYTDKVLIVICEIY